MPFIANTDDDRRAMLAVIGAKNFEELISYIPESARFKGELNVPLAHSEFEVTEALRRLAGRNANTSTHVSFLGGGAYDHYVPAAVGHLLLRPEFFTAYTPYQPEVAQGTLQVIYEFQSMICELTGMYAANASMYDGGSALAEAMLMAHAATGRKKFVLSNAVHPNYRRILRTYSHGQSLAFADVDATASGVTEIAAVNSAIDKDTAAVIVQHPNFFGNLESVYELAELAHRHEALFVVSIDPISLAILEPPGKYGADIVVGEGQCFGGSLNYGGPYLGIFATTEKNIRRMPGRIAGVTVDGQGRRGFALTLQTREQHIRREKATSNICTNQALLATAATIYLSLMGKQGLREIAEQSTQKAHYLAEQIGSISGCQLAFAEPFFKEFAVKLSRPASQVIASLIEKKILAGINLGQFYPKLSDYMLVAVTEKRTRAEMDGFAAMLKSVLA
jgi:glycine dehydrogenase subunit 1